MARSIQASRPNGPQDVCVLEAAARKLLREHFPEDLLFQETGDQQNFQARYVLNHRATGDLSCPAGQTYLKQLDGKHATEAANLAKLTGWSDADVRKRMGSDAPTGSSGRDDWYKKLWK